MAEVLAEYSDVVISQAGKRSIARACGAPAPSGQWQGWIEFIEMATGRALRSGRETTQPNPVDTVYWATGLTPIYLEGALRRALHPLIRPTARPAAGPAFDGPAPTALPSRPLSRAPQSVFRLPEGGSAAEAPALGVFSLAPGQHRP